MAGYRSQLRGILLHLKFQEEIAQAQLAEINRKLSEAEETLEGDKKRMAQTGRNLMEKEAEGILPHELELYQRLIRSQIEKLEAQGKTVQTLLEAYDVKREKLSQAVKEKKVVQKIENKRVHTYMTTIEKKEQLFIDEIAGQSKVKIKGKK